MCHEWGWERERLRERRVRESAPREEFARLEELASLHVADLDRLPLVEEPRREVEEPRERPLTVSR
jgi:hypothetical protein